MEIIGRKCLEGPDMKLGFDKAKVTCFKCKQKEHFKRECSNRQADHSVLTGENILKKMENSRQWLLRSKEQRGRTCPSLFYDAYKEARRANRWSQEKKCFVDPK
ncbi:putative transcription factor interactor and regulator CCHC(Zn) family [Helianthus anomalus]